MILPSGANIVVLASNYNPSIVSKEWLYQRAIFTEPVANFVHTPVFSLVENENFSLTVDEGRFQITVKKVTQAHLNAMSAMAGRFVEILPETPYKAVGMNYHYNVPSEQCNLNAMLSPDKAKLKKLLLSDYELGAMFRFNFEDFVVNFSVQPSFGRGHQFRMSFNFHSDTATADELRNRLAMQTATMEKAETIVQELSENG